MDKVVEAAQKVLHEEHHLEQQTEYLRNAEDIVQAERKAYHEALRAVKRARRNLEDAVCRAQT